MASSHRKSRPTGTRVAGIQTPAFATAALTASVALLTQTANAAPAEPSTPPAPSADDRPSMEEVEAEDDDLYHKAESAADVYNAAKEKATKQQARVDALMDDVAHRTQKVNDARAELGSVATAQYRTATFLLADDPQDYLDQNQLMGRPTARQKDAADDYVTQQAETTRKRQKAAAALESLTESQDELQTTKTAVQTKLVQARRLLSRLTAEEKLRLAAIEREKQARARRQAQELAEQQQTAAEQQRRNEAAAAAAQQSMGSTAPDMSTTIPDSSYATKAEKTLAFARAQVGKPYVWGATGPDSYDCSSLTQAAWRAAGVTLPRTTYDQVNAGTTVSFSDIQPGDLVFFCDDISHVGLYIGNGMMIHAPKPGAYVREESIFYDGESTIHSVVRPA
ncbi:C40 family peptidase [Streptomyces sp. SID12488]|uniref:C40 family peptidase n=1 Tax=Streptomyces sp. SID12488 TaxID=2706040 RepID=UPI0013DD0B78|nr:C40 family peptidase [Streptomyces sp. SID12488]NEA62307.1 glycoside hydrolase [Streptomyces sp. SID12488]